MSCLGTLGKSINETWPQIIWQHQEIWFSVFLPWHESKEEKGSWKHLNTESWGPFSHAVVPSVRCCLMSRMLTWHLQVTQRAYFSYNPWGREANPPPLSLFTYAAAASHVTYLVYFVELSPLKILNDLSRNLFNGLGVVDFKWHWKELCNINALKITIKILLRLLRDPSNLCQEDREIYSLLLIKLKCSKCMVVIQLRASLN